MQEFRVLVLGGVFILRPSTVVAIWQELGFNMFSSAGRILSFRVLLACQMICVF